MVHEDEDNGTDIPEGIFSLLDTDLYKLTMQCAVLKYFPQTEVSYAFTNRTPNMKLTREAFVWLQRQIDKLANVYVSDSEIEWLRKECEYLGPEYLRYLTTLRLKPSEQVELKFTSQDGSDTGDLSMSIKGLWVDTILYEIPLLALTSEAYFKFCDTDWDHEGQVQKAYEKGRTLLQEGCLLSEFGSRRRRDYKTHDLIMKGLCQASQEAKVAGWTGKFAGTSNVHFANKYGVAPVGTVAHEWYMGIAAITDDYEHANEKALSYWLGCFGEGVLGIALTDTFGTPDFFKSFKMPIPRTTLASAEAGAVAPSTVSGTTQAGPGSPAETLPPVQAQLDADFSKKDFKSYAQVFTGVRQDSGDPKDYVKMARQFYDSVGIKEKKVIVFSDSLNTERCIEYKKVAEENGFIPSFGVGTFFTNDFVRKSDGKKSIPLNIVIKISYAGGRPAVKISDNIGKNTGDEKTVEDVKRRLGYIEKAWHEGNEATRWGSGK
ncbi:putative nicotinate phosphoribosyltransferase [Phaeomoniella chlamydospora]|uniref:nicotinate phosphoribosyltransferase n=1 Tax=Phaeomoniella chlamydospora TaxID=158046 RepID=A0A0G2FUX4_PHACM|nr:putative nicotinate phosphoribosyltransferase [Phaeomoniella chlamydospora]